MRVAGHQGAGRPGTRGRGARRHKKVNGVECGVPGGAGPGWGVASRPALGQAGPGPAG